MNLLIETETVDSVWPKFNDQLLHISQAGAKKDPQLKHYFLKYYALALNNLGYLHMEKGAYDQALFYYESALKIEQENNNKPGIAAVNLNLGYIYNQQGNISRALESYHYALKVAIDTKNAVVTGTAYSNIGYVFDVQGDYHNALDYYGKALDVYKKNEIQDGIAQCYGNMGYVYAVIGDPDCKGPKLSCKTMSTKKGIDYLLKAAEIDKRLNDDISLANVYNILGGVYEHNGDPECTGDSLECKVKSKKLALENYEMALRLRLSAGHKLGVSQSYGSLAEFMFSNGQVDVAFDYAKKSLAVAKEISSPEKIKDAALILKRIYQQKGNTGEALKMYELYIQMKDSTSNEETRKLVMKKTLQIEYERRSATDSLKAASEKREYELTIGQERTQKTALYAGLALVLVFSGFIYNRFRITNKQKKIIELKEQEAQQHNTIIANQKQLVEEKQKEILDSIHYARRIQNALLAHEDFLHQNLSSSFVFFKPKDIVSGDFYWVAKHGSYFYLAVCDSTGHGVPGAFMSLLNIGFLSEAINEKNIFSPDEVFNYVRTRLESSISKEGQQDGFDGILLRVDLATNSVTYAAANNAPLLVRNHEITELEKDKMPVGKGERKSTFNLFSLQLLPGDKVYLYTDGYADQFGGEKGKKFKYKELNQLLLATSSTIATDQHKTLSDTFDKWKGNLEQVDDVLVVGFSV